MITKENAERWRREQDKFIFVIDLLGISAHDPDADERVEEVEQAFENLLKENSDEQV